MKTFIRALCVALGVLWPGVGPAAEVPYDIVVYGGNSAGVVAAAQAAKMGKKVVVIEQGKHLGGMTSGGLGASDFGAKTSIGGITLDFFHYIDRYYRTPSNWKHSSFEEYLATKEGKWHFGQNGFYAFEPHVAEQWFNDLVAQNHVPVVFGERLDLKSGVEKQNARIISIRTESGKVFKGKMFIDATYEGDLMAKAGVSYIVGRESNAAYGEQFNGVIVNSDKDPKCTAIDPYVVPGNPASGVLPNIHTDSPGQDGEADHQVQAYCYRLCFTDVPENKIPFAKPADYNEKQYEILFRYYAAGGKEFLLKVTLMPNRKTDTNNSGIFSTDYIGMSQAYPEADYATRDKILDAHISYTKGLLWALANDERIPVSVREKTALWGLAKDEFKDTGNWPHQFYIREARRMISDYVMTEQDIMRVRMPEDPVALGSYAMDSHCTQRFLDKEGHLRTEGGMFHGKVRPYGISYRSIIPKAEECTNLLVPVCLSATHSAYGSIRMEPVYMMLGQSAATAASLAIDLGCTLQQVPYPTLQKSLLADKQSLEWAPPNGGKKPTKNP
jgi:hypothetical protein